MADFQYSCEAVVGASPQAVFDIVSDLSRHTELAGSGEVISVSQKTPGPVGFGTIIEASETVPIGDDSMDLTAQSLVVTHDPGKSFSWVTVPTLPEQVRRIQWRFDLSPDGSGTKVNHSVELEWGDIQDPTLQGLRDNYEQIRAGYVRDGMDKTLGNLKSMAEG